MLANLNALESDTFAASSLGRKSKVGTIPADQINLWGGSLSIGHPFGVREPLKKHPSLWRHHWRAYPLSRPFSRVPPSTACPQPLTLTPC